MTMKASLSVDDELLGVTVRLIEQFPQVPAGSVMRLVGRVVHGARWTGVPPDLLPVETERTARILLTRRCSGASGADFADLSGTRSGPDVEATPVAQRMRRAR